MAQGPGAARTGFERIRVLDLGWVWAGAVAGHVFADMGAEVIKVETRKRLDPARQGRPIVGDTPDPEQNPSLMVIGRQVRTSFGGALDLLCMDGDGNLVVVELKRGQTPAGRHLPGPGVFLMGQGTAV